MSLNRNNYRTNSFTTPTHNNFKSNVEFEAWEEVLFKKTISELSERICSYSLSEFQFDLIVREANIKFLSLKEQMKFRQLFSEQEMSSKESLLNLLQLCKTVIVNNTRYLYVLLSIISIVKMKKVDELFGHADFKCFQWWKEFMREKYGADMRWFDVIARKKDCFRIKAFDFKENVTRMLRNTLHHKCANSIATQRKRTAYHNQRESRIRRPASRESTLNPSKKISKSLTLMNENSVEIGFKEDNHHPNPNFYSVNLTPTPIPSGQNPQQQLQNNPRKTTTPSAALYSLSTTTKHSKYRRLKTEEPPAIELLSTSTTGFYAVERKMSYMFNHNNNRFLTEQNNNTEHESNIELNTNLRYENFSIENENDRNDSSSLMKINRGSSLSLQTNRINLIPSSVERIERKRKVNRINKINNNNNNNICIKEKTQSYEQLEQWKENNNKHNNCCCNNISEIRKNNLKEHYISTTKTVANEKEEQEEEECISKNKNHNHNNNHHNCNC